MSWQTVAWKDVRDSIRSRGLWALLALFGLLVAVFAYVGWVDQGSAVEPFVVLTAEGFGIIVPIVAIVIGYKAVIEERRSGTIALLLSFPHTRRDIVLGKFVGRALVLTVPLLLALGAMFAVIVTLYDNAPVGSYLLFVGLNVVYGVAFLAIAIGLSMVLRSGRQVTAGAFGAYIILVMFWDALITVLWRFNPPNLQLPDWALLVQLASPVESYNRIVDALFDLEPGLTPTLSSAEAPWYVGPEVAFVVLIGWIGLTLGLGYAQFRRTDL